MGFMLKPGIDTGRKVSLSAKKPILTLVLLFLFISSACSRGVYVSALDLTATAQSAHGENIPKPQGTSEIQDPLASTLFVTPLSTLNTAPIGGGSTPEAPGVELTETAIPQEPTLNPNP